MMGHDAACSRGSFALDFAAVLLCQRLTMHSSDLQVASGEMCSLTELQGLLKDVDSVGSRETEAAAKLKTREADALNANQEVAQPFCPPPPPPPLPPGPVRCSVPAEFIK